MLLISCVMMLVAFAINSMLPALPAIGEALGVRVDNERQFVITAFMIGFGVAQFFVGAISDRYGRRGLMLMSLGGYALTSLAATFAPSFETLLLARFAQGMATAGARVLVNSVVRDRFEGREMAQVMSLASTIFMAAPILAPLMGQAVLMVAPWRWIFAALAMLGATVGLWVLTRLPETLDPANRREINPRDLKISAAIVLGDRQRRLHDRQHAGDSGLDGLSGFGPADLRRHVRPAQFPADRLCDHGDGDGGGLADQCGDRQAFRDAPDRP